MAEPGPDYDVEYDDDWDNGDCFQCGGEGFYANCFEEWACMYPDEGCDLCIRRCDVCRPRKPDPETIALQQVLADALNKAGTP